MFLITFSRKIGQDRFREIEQRFSSSRLRSSRASLTSMPPYFCGRLLHFGETDRGYMTRFIEHQRSFAKMGIDIEVDLLRTVSGNVRAPFLETLTESLSSREATFTPKLTLKI